MTFRDSVVTTPWIGLHTGCVNVDSRRLYAPESCSRTFEAVTRARFRRTVTLPGMSGNRIQADAMASLVVGWRSLRDVTRPKSNLHVIRNAGRTTGWPLEYESGNRFAGAHPFVCLVSVEQSPRKFEGHARFSVKFASNSIIVIEIVVVYLNCSFDSEIERCRAKFSLEIIPHWRERREG